MKILYFGGGLGNQIFEYSFYLALKERFPNENIFGVYPDFKFREHIGGFEVEKIFDVKFPATSFKAKLIVLLLFLYKKINPQTSLCSLHPVNVNWDSIVFNAFKSDLSFYKERKEWLEYKNISLDLKNRKIIDKILTTNSVAIHVRRGDFLSPKYNNILGNIATLAYYQKALDIIKSKISDPYFFVFSDDMIWCKTVLNLPEKTVYVDWNKGKDSFLDMYLMTFTKANIIANSTFSYWGAYLNKNTPIVVYPEKWINADYYPNIFPADWIGVNVE
ncbi:alpha-1,2-fucosyltransferase [Bacteroides xylanisolvens]|jgi:hypothetical protein|uniref:Alpha-1,2-fucosyltransferase n=1 Tax=Bacteroides xylanisolvens TaxID=371601 RepID=A0AAW4TAF8_9BACE|nr:alpha-1,2-fucosyltransferase [Bacteroides xylanisolvens]MCA4535170.1 alpha-1,2-fucosyltransferase [Bacteroides xylanisolvens]MCA4553232.1 alpha-1,2-fucosyltransferase [Bacteroides xylanisolvens]MCA4566896.1 alpha-1,2-fucosyltransferase [Bacteroides xylanisolvens]MCA4571780.1 alpha-1,2-fucosyltransferase [Bacteroides xylanisolvens]MCA4602282.1 alpha-1,2-fucosyltransferase [Bacteroides xylanisolvens]